MLGPCFSRDALARRADSKSGDEAEWKRTVESAKKEGAVVVAGSPIP